MAKRGKKKPRKTKFYKKAFKLSESQNKTLRQFCKTHSTTEIKVFRMALMDYLKRNARHVENHHHIISPNQLTLFDVGDESLSTGT